MEVNGPGSVHGSLPIQPSRPAAEAAKTEPVQPVSTRDEVEISEAGRLLDSLSQSSEVRSERLAQIRAAIEAGQYETAEKLEAALDKLLRDINSDDQRNG